jgi:hypothetical protein
MVCGPTGVATPPKKGLVAKARKNPLEPKTSYARPTSFSRETAQRAGCPIHINRPLEEGLAAKLGQFLTAPTPRILSNIFHLNARNTPEQMRRVWKYQPTPTNWPP